MMSAEALSRTWGICKTIAENTIKETRERAMRAVAYPNIERHWPTGDRPLQYCQFNHQVYHNNSKSLVTSLRRYTCCEIYATAFGWSRNLPMKRKYAFQKSLYFSLSRYGKPEALILDGAKA
jgi:hypothetical protein